MVSQLSFFYQPLPFCPRFRSWSSASRVYLNFWLLTAMACVCVCVISSPNYLQVSLLMASRCFQQAGCLISQGLFLISPPEACGLGAPWGCWGRRPSSPGYALCSHSAEYVRVLLSLSEMPFPGQFLLVLQVSNQASLPPGSSLTIQTGLGTGFFHNQLG